MQTKIHLHPNINTYRNTKSFTQSHIYKHTKKHTHTHTNLGILTKRWYHCHTSNQLFAVPCFLYDFCNTGQYLRYGEGCSSRTNVWHQKLHFSLTHYIQKTTLLENHFIPSSGFVILMSVGLFKFLLSVNNRFKSKSVKWQRTETITN